MSYRTEKNEKVRGFFTSKAPLAGSVTDAQYKGEQTPAIGQYNNLNYALKKPTAPRLVSKVPRFLPEVRKSSAPGIYNVNEAVTSKYQSAKKQNFSRLPKKTFLDRLVKEKNKVPAVGAYDTAKADKYLTISVRRSYK